MAKINVQNEEGIDFCFLLIRVINPDAIIQRDDRGTLENFNRRGIIIAEYVGENYQLTVRNEDFFESDSEGGDGYFVPELNMEISDSDGNIEGLSEYVRKFIETEK